MLILIAESKTMSAVQREVSADEYRIHMPCFEAYAEEIAEFVTSLDVGGLADRVKISPRLASKALFMMYDFPNKSTGIDSMAAFTGEVYKALDFSTLPNANAFWGTERLMIISSLYGLLRADDIVKPYRLDYTADCAPDGERIFRYWKEKNTEAIALHLMTTGEREILDLMPGDAARCIDMKALKATAKIIKPDFRMITGSGRLVTPNSGKLKELRGLMLRKIFMDRVDSLQMLLSMESDSFAPYEALSSEETPVFIVR